MGLEFLPDTYENDRIISQDIESNKNIQNPPKFPCPRAELEYDNRPYTMTSEFTGRITFHASTNHITPETIYLGTIDGLRYDGNTEDISRYSFIYTAYRGNDIFYVNPEMHEFELFEEAMRAYVEAPVTKGQHAGWDQAIENSKNNIARILEQTQTQEAAAD